MKTSDLIGAALDWAVCVCEGESPSRYTQYSTDWAVSGPIIERERISPTYSQMNKDWQAAYHEGPQSYIHAGSTPLIAAMRCYVASQLGDEIDVPEELK
jgi:hypothetical protein